MHFGYEALWTLAFVPAGFVIVIAASLAFVAVYGVGARRGAQAAGTYTTACSWLFLAALGVDVVYGVSSGQMGVFLERYGALPLIEMGLLGFMSVASMWLMAVSYTRDKRRETTAASAVGTEE